MGPIDRMSSQFCPGSAWKVLGSPILSGSTDRRFPGKISGTVSNVRQLKLPTDMAAGMTNHLAVPAHACAHAHLLIRSTVLFLIRVFDGTTIAKQGIKAELLGW